MWKLRCQQVYFPGHQCQYATHGTGIWCRWHKVLHEFRQDNERLPFVAQTHMYGAGMNMIAAAYCLVQFGDSPQLFWFLGAVLALGWGLTLFADGIMARDYPLSQFAFWAKLLAVGMVLTVIAGLGMAVYVMSDPDKGLIILDKLKVGSGDSIDTYGPPILVSLMVVLSLFNLDLFVRRILFYKPREWGYFLMLIGMGLIAAAFQSVFQDKLPSLSISRDELTSDSGSVIGQYGQTALTIAFVIGFAVAEVINAGMRRAELDDEGFKNTVWISYPICVGAPSIGILVGAYSLHSIGFENKIGLVLLAAIVAGVTCSVATNWIIGRQRSTY